MQTPRSNYASRSSLALANLRALVILIVLAFHSMLAYVVWNAPTDAGFDAPPYIWRAFPIADNHRWFGFDLFCAWQDVYLMSLMFFLSGLFVWPSLTRKKEWAFVRDRVLRLGVPYAFGVAVLMPLAIYPAYAVRNADPSIAAYWHALLQLPYWPNGPLWFLWQLLALNLIAAAVHRAAPSLVRSLGRWSAAAENHFAQWFVALIAVSALAYIPLAVIFTPWAWSNSGLLAVQLCRPLACAAGSLFLIAVSLRFATRQSRILDSLSANAYALYLFHYGFVVWLQYTLLTAALFAVVKAAIVFGGTLALSWIAALAVQRISFGARLIGAPWRAVTASRIESARQAIAAMTPATGQADRPRY